MKLTHYLPLAICLAILVTHSHAQSLHLLDDFEDGDAAEWLRTDYSASRGAHEVVDGNFVITGSQRGQGQDFDWGSGLYGDVSIQTQFRITAEDTAGVYARSTLDMVNGSRKGYQPWAALRGDGLLTVGRSLNGGVSFLRRVNTDWDPTGQDVNMQFDLFGHEVSLTAWPDGTDQPPPQIMLNLPNESSFVDAGRIGIWTFQRQGTSIGPVEFRHVEAIVDPQVRASLDAAYSVRDRESPLDGLGDAADSRQSNPTATVGERDTPDGNEIVRLVTKFGLPAVADGAQRLASATLSLFLEDIAGTPPGPVSLFHSDRDNDLDVLSSDYENDEYTDTLLDLVQPTDAGQMRYELDVTDFVRADYATDAGNPMSAFRLQVSEAEFVEDDQSHRYRFTTPGAQTNHPELVLTFVDSVLGDVNLDGEVNGLDVDPFVDTLLNGPYQAAADMNDDQVVNGLDVDPFVAAVVGGAAQAQVPEPSTFVLCSIALVVVGGWRKWGG